MKRLFLFAVLAAVAGAGSAFTNAKTVTSNSYLVQTVDGQYVSVLDASSEGRCTELLSENYCKYTITPAGKLNINEANAPFDMTEIASFLSQPTPYIQVDDSQKRIYDLD